MQTHNYLNLLIILLPIIKLKINTHPPKIEGWVIWNYR